MASHVEQLESVIGLLGSIDSGKLDPVYDSLAVRVAGQGHKDIAEAYEILGAEAAEKYIPQSRTAIRAKRERMRMEHEQNMLELEYRRREAEVKLLEAQAQAAVDDLNNPPTP